MNAVVFKGPRKVAVEQRPVPEIQGPKDVIIHVQYTALCGSDLHLFRGVEPCEPGTILGHEFCGNILSVGSEVTNFAVGDLVVSPFTVSCQTCFYCKNGYSSRCTECRVFGTQQLDGAMSQYVRVPMADTTIMRAPEGIEPKRLVLMADMLPTGYFAASSAFSLLPSPDHIKTSTVVVIGCGPVGLCAIVAALARHPVQVFAIDAVQSRLATAAKLGATPLCLDTGVENIQAVIKEATEGRGADVAIEMVGKREALRMAFEVLRPWGVLVSAGVHVGDYPWTLSEAYDKNLRMQMGRCPVRTLFPAALDLLRNTPQLVDVLKMEVLPLSDAVDAFARFERMEVQKVIFDAQK